MIIFYGSIQVFEKQMGNKVISKTFFFLFTIKTKGLPQKSVCVCVCVCVCVYAEITNHKTSLQKSFQTFFQTQVKEMREMNVTYYWDKQDPF